MLALLAASMLIWVVQTDRWTAEAWNYPTVYSGDAFEMLARIKASSEGDIWPLRPQRIARLGAPFGADWSAYPTPEKLQLLFLGGVARLSNVFVAANVGLMLAFGLNATMFYWVVRRWLRVRWEWAMTGALLFAFNYSIYHRGLAHFSFVFTWIVPLGLLACWLVAKSSRLRGWGLGPAVCLAAGIALGCHNTYYLFFWLQLMGWALLMQWLGPRRPENLRVGLAAIGVALVVFFAVNCEYWLYSDSADALPLLERNYGGTERYALKVVEMFIPPGAHRADLLAFFGQRYSRWSDWRGEEYLPYLGLVGLAGLVWLAGVTVPRLLRGQKLPGQALAAGWLVAYGAVGGLTNLLAFFGGFYAFRATNRVVVFVAAIILAFLVVRLSRLSARWPAWLRYGAALSVAILGIADQLPRAETIEPRTTIRAAVNSDREFARALEAGLPAGATVFQLPVLGFPEVTPPWRLGDYEHFRPYLLSQTLHFSYGVPKFRPRGRWQTETQSLPPLAMVHRLEKLGFAALYINRKGYEDNGEKMIETLTAAGYNRQIRSPLGGQVAVLLNPAPVPELPFAHGLTVGRGWQNRPIKGVRWAYGDASLLYYNPNPGRVKVRLWLQLEVPRTQKITLTGKDSVVLAANDAPAGELALTVKEVELEPGLNTFEIAGGAPVRDGPGRNQLRAFGLVSSEVKPIAAGAD
ncbi:MAG: hypothetical protein HYV75_08580 [Opitutae bacterium]|nr:hypothetical protein [Opitutae bacterium]